MDKIGSQLRSNAIKNLDQKNVLEKISNQSKSLRKQVFANPPYNFYKLTFHLHRHM